MATEFSTAEQPATFHVKNVKKKRDQRRPDEPKFSANGRPGKRTPQLEKDLLAAIETGAPYRIACMACGISDDSFANWRRKDADFAKRVEVASGKTALRLLKKIEKNADENFSAAAWLLERRFPENFSRPEIQLGVAMQFNSTTNNTIVITAEQAASLQKRNSVIDKQLDEISQSYESRQKLANGSTESTESAKPSGSVSSEVIREVESSASSLVASGPISLPPGSPGPSWWRSLSAGSGERPVSAETAEFVLGQISTQVLGTSRGEKVKVDFGDSDLTLGGLWSKLEETVGPSGWAALVDRGARQEGPAASAGRGARAKGHREG